jgi:integrase/recombinase XerC
MNTKPKLTQARKIEPYITAYLDKLRLIRARATVENHHYQIVRFCAWCKRERIAWAQVTREQVERYLVALPYCDKHRLNCCRALQTYYEFHRITPNPVAAIVVKASCIRKPPANLPAQVSIQSIIDNVANPSDELRVRNRLMIELAYGSGLRRGELLGLSIEDIDLAGGMAVVTGKGDKSRTVPLTKKSCDLLKEYLQRCGVASGPLFRNARSGRRLSEHHISKLFHTLTGHNTHSFRHACATHLLAQGCDLRTIQTLLGHKQLCTTEFYTQVDKSQLRSVLERTHPRKGANA